MSADVYDIDCLVIGAGAVGLACGAALAQRGRDVLVVEAAPGIGTGVSSRNSEVIHAGIYYPTASLRRRLCVEGRRLLYPFLESRAVGHRKSGKLIVAANAEEETQIAALYKRSLENDVEGMRQLTRGEALAMEPNLACVAALYSPETGIIDSHGYMLALQGEIESAGGTIVFNAPVEGGSALTSGGFEVRIGGDDPMSLRCRSVVNAAALGAQAVATAFDGVPRETIPPLKLSKGSYFGCAGRPAFTRLIYPAPSHGGLGVHLTLDLAGRMRFGPDIEWLDHGDPSRVNYAVDPARADSFYAAIRRYWPGLRDGALTPDYSGCRPRIYGRNDPAADFRIDGPEVHRLDGLVNLFGIESPGLTSSLAIAEETANRLEGGVR